MVSEWDDSIRRVRLADTRRVEAFQKNAKSDSWFGVRWYCMANVQLLLIQRHLGKAAIGGASCA